MKSNVPWHMQDEETEIQSMDNLPENAYGFVYAIAYTDGTYYIGKKDLYKKVTLPALKNGKQRENSTQTYKNIDKSRVYFDILYKESDWLNYVGSSELTKNLEISQRIILHVSFTKRNLTYMEAKILFAEEVLEDDLCHNQNILGSFFKGNIN